MSRRASGTGSVITRKDGRLVLCIEGGWNRHGVRRQIRRVTPKGTTRPEADRMLLRLLRETNPETAASPTTVKTYADVWLPRVQQHLRPSSLMVTVAALRWIVPAIGHRRLDRLTPGDIRAVSKAILDGSLAPSTASRYRGVLAKMLKDARLDGHQVPAVVDDVEGVPQGESTRGAIPTDHAILILAAAAERPDRSRWAAALLQGMRPAEVLGLTWDHVDLDKGMVLIEWQLQALPYLVARDRRSGFKVPVSYVAHQLEGRWHLVRPKTKSGQRYIAMDGLLVEWLRDWYRIAEPSPHNLVWSEHGHPIDPKDDRKAWRDVCHAAREWQQQAGQTTNLVKVYDLYAARHTTATLLSELGASDEVITAIVGHSSIASTRPYKHARAEAERAALRAVAERLGIGLGKSG
jgi:integrase